MGYPPMHRAGRGRARWSPQEKLCRVRVRWWGPNPPAPHGLKGIGQETAGIRGVWQSTDNHVSRR